MQLAMQNFTDMWQAAYYFFSLRKSLFLATTHSTIACYDLLKKQVQLKLS
jgi:hypothetical protein